MDYDPSHCKASTLISPSLWVIHPLLSGTEMGWGDNTRVISYYDFKYLLSIVDGVPYHLGYVVATILHHQAIDSWINVIFVGSYITQLIRGMNLLEGVDKMRWVGGFTPINLDNFYAISIPLSVVPSSPTSQSISSFILAPDAPSLPKFSRFSQWLGETLQSITDH